MLGTKVVLNFKNLETIQFIVSALLGKRTIDNLTSFEITFKTFVDVLRILNGALYTYTVSYIMLFFDGCILYKIFSQAFVYIYNYYKNQIFLKGKIIILP